MRHGIGAFVLVTYPVLEKVFAMIIVLLFLQMY